MSKNKFHGIDLTGKKFGNLTAIKANPFDEREGTYWLFSCSCEHVDCEELKSISISKVLGLPGIKSCGKGYYTDLRNKRFNGWTVLKMAHRPDHLKTKGTYWLCECSCGTQRIILSSNLRRNLSKGCAKCGNKITHGMTHTRLHTIWTGMKARATAVKGHREYERYKHVDLCLEWYKFEAFRDWALASGYKENLSLDRKNGELGYNPDNCRWATRIVQSRNQRRRKATMKKGNFTSIYQRTDNKKLWQARVTSTYDREGNKLPNKKTTDLFGRNFKSKHIAAVMRDLFILENNLEHTRNFHWLTPDNEPGWAFRGVPVPLI